MKVAIINYLAVARILKGTSGMTFVIDSFSDKIAHVRDYRYEGANGKFQIWSLTSEMYEVVEE